MNTLLEKKVRRTVLLVDDHLMIREGLKSLLSTNSEYEIVGEAKDGLESIKKILDLKPNIVFLDVNLPKLCGLQVLKKCKKYTPDCKFIVYSNYISESEYAKSIALKADGILLKEVAWAEIMTCLKKISFGQQYISPLCTKMFQKEVKLNIEQDHINKAALTSLSKNEMTILRLISKQKTTKQISEKLFKSPKTIENVRYKICRKLGLSGHNSLTIFAIQNGCFFSE